MGRAGCGDEVISLVDFIYKFTGCDQQDDQAARGKQAIEAVAAVIAETQAVVSEQNEILEAGQSGTRQKRSP